MSRLWHRLFSIPPEDVGFERRGFRGGDADVRAHIEKIGATFLTGYHRALREPRPEPLGLTLNETEADYRGFAFEGAAMALTILDALTPWRRRRLADFLAGPGGAHVYMVHVGAGWAAARLPFHPRRTFERLDELLRWLAADGYGFHQGYFHWPRSIEGPQEVPRRITGYARRAFDQGLGRSLWFVEGADVHRIAVTVASFPRPRRADLWSGVGLACAYAGGIEPAVVETLRAAGHGFEAELAQGAAFAAKARQRAGNLTERVGTACRILCGCSAGEAATVTDVVLRDLPADGAVPAYEGWRQGVGNRLRN